MLGRSILNLLGASAMLGAMVAVALPLGLNAVDRTGQPIPCGSAFSPDYEVAGKQDLLNLDQHTLAGPAFATSDYVVQCAGLVTNRRNVALSVGGGGAALLLTVFAVPYAVRMVSSRRGRKAEYARPAEPVRDQSDHARMGAQWVTHQVGTGSTQPILEKSVGEQIGSNNYAARTRGADGVAAAAAALRRDGVGHAGGAGGGVGQFYAVAGNG